MNKQIFIVMCLALQGCATTDSLTMPTGNWQTINQPNFIPPKAQTTFVLSENNNTKEAEKAKVAMNLDFLWSK